MVKPGATLIDVGINRVTDPAELEKFFPSDPERAATFCQTRLCRRRRHPPRGIREEPEAYTPVQAAWAR